MNVIDVNLTKLVIFIVITSGNRRVISTSKIKKITAIRKNWREKGIRAVDLGSKPHSKGDLFSRSINVFFEMIVASIIIIIVIVNVKITREIISNIIYTNLVRSFDWKSNIILILYKYLPHQ